MTNSRFASGISCCGRAVGSSLSAEATHIYDPAVTLWEAYRVLFHQWRLAYEIGAANRAAGARPMTIRESVTLVRSMSAAG